MQHILKNKDVFIWWELCRSLIWMHLLFPFGNKKKTTGICTSFLLLWLNHLDLQFCKVFLSEAIPNNTNLRRAIVLWYFVKSLCWKGKWKLSGNFDPIWIWSLFVLYNISLRREQQFNLKPISHAEITQWNDIWGHYYIHTVKDTIN